MKHGRGEEGRRVGEGERGVEESRGGGQRGEGRRGECGCRVGRVPKTRINVGEVRQHSKSKSNQIN